MKTRTQQLILACVEAHSGQFLRSEIAKLLVGSHSIRIAPHKEDPFYGRLAEYSRKMLLYDIDILLQQGYLHLDANQKMVTIISSASTSPL